MSPLADPTELQVTVLGRGPYRLAPGSWLPAKAPGGACLLIQRAQAPTLPESFLTAASTMFAADPRVASVSLVDDSLAALVSSGGAASYLSHPFPANPRQLYGSSVTGAAVVLNPAVFDLVGDPDDGFAALTVDSVRAWALRGNHRGLRHLWWWSGGPGTGTPVWGVPELESAEAELAGATFCGLLDAYRAAHLAITVAVEARWLGPDETGAQVATLHWLERLAQRPDIAEIRLHNLPGGRLPDYARTLAGLAAIRVVRSTDDVARADVFWRPYQPDERTEHLADRVLGRRLVTTVLDLIEYSNSRYHGDGDSWAQRRALLRENLNAVDFVTAISNDVIDHLSAEVPGLDLDRMGCTHLGTDHLVGAAPSDMPEELAARLPTGDPFVLVLGNDFAHKNRDFAIRVWQGLPAGSPVNLVLAGLHVAASSTKQTEDALLLGGHGPGQVLRLAHVSGPARDWLMANAAVVMYPTSAEGFGFVPHEAASLGVPSLYTEFGPLAETLPAGEGLPNWQLADYTRRLSELLAGAGAANAAALRAADKDLNWEVAAERLAGFMRRALTVAPRRHLLAKTDRDRVEAELRSTAEAELLIRQMTSSNSWKLTAPLRKATELRRRRRHGVDGPNA